MEYNWASYYKTAYETEKKRAQKLSGQVADALAKQEMLSDNLRRIEANPIYKASQPKKVIKAIARKVKSGLKHDLKAGKCKSDVIWEGDICTTLEGKLSPEKKEVLKKAAIRYNMDLCHQVDRYASWISVQESRAFEKIPEIKEYRHSCPNVIPSVQEPGVQVLSYENWMDEVLIGDICLLAENPKELAKEAGYYVQGYFRENPQIYFAYGHEDLICDGKRAFPWFKPIWSPDTLMGFFYIGSYFAIRREILEKARALVKDSSGYILCNASNSLLRARKCTYSLVWHALEAELLNQKSQSIGLMDVVLYHNTVKKLPQVDASFEYFLNVGTTILDEHKEFWGFEKEYIELKQDLMRELLESNHKNSGMRSVEHDINDCLQTGSFKRYQTGSITCYQTAHPEVWTVLPNPDNATLSTESAVIPSENHSDAVTLPMVSVVIPSKDHPDVVETCITSFLQKTAYKHVEFILVDNGSGSENKEKTEAFLRKIQTEYSVKSTYLYEPMEFNFSRMCNLGVEKAEGEYILLLNDDMEIIEENWLHIMLGQALLPGTGAVGAKLWYPGEMRIQHTGITNLQIGPSHKLVTFPDDRSYYYGHNTLPYDMIAVTAACLLVKKDIYEEVGGLNETMKVAYNDVDFCFKVYEAGYRNVIRNDAVLIHHESLSRGLDEGSEEKWTRLLHEKEGLYRQHEAFRKEDLYYSEHLADNALEYRVGFREPYEMPFDTKKPEKISWAEAARLLRNQSDKGMLTVERAIYQQKLHLEDPDILFVEGWSYLLNADNAFVARKLILMNTENRDCYSLNVFDRQRPDVSAILPNQTHIDLAGFTCRIRKEEMEKLGSAFMIGMIFENLMDGKVYCRMSDKVLKV